MAESSGFLAPEKRTSREKAWLFLLDLKVSSSHCGTLSTIKEALVSVNAFWNQEFQISLIDKYLYADR